LSDRRREQVGDLKARAKLMKQHLAYLEGRSSRKVEPIKCARNLAVAVSVV
jgi:hypothetical protein